MSPIRSQRNPAAVALGFLCLLLTVAGCARKPEIVGEVVDGFGAVLAPATVAVEGTTFKTVTDAQGRYRVGYVPGKVRVTVSKAGYVPASNTFEIAVEATFPADKSVLHKIPPGPGVWFIGSSDYMRVNQGKIRMSSRDTGFGFKVTRETTYSPVGNSTAIEKAGILQFVDSSKANLILLRLERDALLVRTTSLGESKDKVNRIQTESVRLSADLKLVQVSLEPGRYAFVDGPGELDELGAVLGWGEGVREPIFLFRVMRQPAEGAPDRDYYRELIERDLQKAVEAQKAYFAQHNAYATCENAAECAARLPGFAPSQGVELMMRVEEFKGRKWLVAETTHPMADARCEYDTEEDHFFLITRKEGAEESAREEGPEAAIRMVKQLRVRGRETLEQALNRAAAGPRGDRQVGEFDWKTVQRLDQEYEITLTWKAGDRVHLALWRVNVRTGEVRPQGKVAEELGKGNVPQS